MIESPPLGGTHVQVLRSQLALEVALTSYALVAALLLVRLLFLLLRVHSRIWSADGIYTVTDPIVWPLTLLPGANRTLVGFAALPDLTAVALVAVVPLLAVARNLAR